MPATERLFEIVNGAGDGIRTRDLLLGKEMLYQLSHSRKQKGISDQKLVANTFSLVTPVGFEPTIFTLRG